MNRFHPALVILHWVIALLIVFSLVYGSTMVDHLPDDIDKKTSILKIHFGAGFAVLFLMIIRVVFKKFTRTPPPVDENAIKTNKLSKLVHLSLYILIFLACISGIVTAFIYGLIPSLFIDSDFLMPTNFADDIISAEIHEVMTNFLIVLVFLHIVATLIHQFIWKDKLLSRMWFNTRK